MEITVNDFRLQYIFSIWIIAANHDNPFLVLGEM